MTSAVIIDDAMRGYNIQVVYTENHHFVAQVTDDDHNPVLRVEIARGSYHITLADHIPDVQRIIDRINDHLYKYTRVKVELGTAPMIHTRGRYVAASTT